MIWPPRRLLGVALAQAVGSAQPVRKGQLRMQMVFEPVVHRADGGDQEGALRVQVEPAVEPPMPTAARPPLSRAKASHRA